MCMYICIYASLDNHYAFIEQTQSNTQTYHFISCNSCIYQNILSRTFTRHLRLVNLFFELLLEAVHRIIATWKYTSSTTFAFLDDEMAFMLNRYIPHGFIFPLCYYEFAYIYLCIKSAYLSVLQGTVLKALIKY